MREDRPAEDPSDEAPLVDVDEDADGEEQLELTGFERCRHFTALAFAAALFPLRTASTTIGTFLHNWWTSRPIGLIFWGLPAAVVLLGAGYLAVALRPTSSELIVQYREAAAEAADAGDTVAAALWLEKTLQLNPLDPEHLYNLAVAASLKGQEERAREIIGGLAPEDGLGYPPAHFWMAGDLVTHEQPLSSAAEQRVEYHLLQAATGDTNRVEAHVMLGELYLKRNEVNRAIDHFRQAAPARPDVHFSLAQALRAAGRVDESLESAAKARDHFRQRCQEEPLVSDHRRGWAFAEQILGNHPEAVRILEGGLDSDDPQLFHASLVDVYINWHNAQVLSGNVNLAWQLEVLSRALEHGPNDPRLLTQLAKLAVKDWEQADEAYLMLKELVARGVAPAMVHLIIGTRELKEGRYDQAKMHLQLADDRDPQTPTILNNLAWLLAHQQQPDLPGALELAEAAKSISDRPEICDTLGTILARMGRNREAVRELESALRGLPGNGEIHGKLADLYDKLGDSELARIHRELDARAEANP